ncbi:MAG: serine/threonine-protein kinase [Gemmatimonadales bacterium]
MEFAGSAFRRHDSQLEAVGPYRVLEVLGEGGMGVVYLAEQTEPVRRQVALKIIKPGMDTKQVVARFDAERQALAVMDHPNIAKVYDGGATESGRPYFVMELARGVPITEYCDAHKLSVRERLELFIPVCHAVQHAHQKGVIHRDMKPSNVLVTIQDGKEPVPKVIDFGIAKAMGQRLTEMTLHTQRGEAIGTPAYMSPEQAEMSGLDVDTRTDIYSLGVILYELLAGELPYDLEDLAGMAALVTLRETDPPTPSRRFKTLGDRQEYIARQRHTDPGSLRRALKGDLDWITMKAMEKDRTRRYETANGLALDIQRFLHNQPVMARAPSTGYRVGKFVQRHKAGTGFAAVLLAVLVGFAVTMSVQAARIAEERDRANNEAETAQQVSDFLVEIFGVTDPSEARGNTITAREILDRGAERIETELADQPLVQARLMGTMGEVYRALGLYEPAAPLLERAVTLAGATLGDEDVQVASYLLGLGTLYRAQGRFDEADSVLQRSLAMLESAPERAPEDMADVLHELGVLYAEEGRNQEAEPLFRRSLEINERLFGSSHTRVAWDLNSLGAVYWSMGRLEEAEPLLERSVTIREETLGADHPQVAVGLTNLAVLKNEQRKFDEAEPLFRRALAIEERALGPDHPSVGVSLMNLANLYANQERYVEAEPLFIRSLEIAEGALGPEHPDLGLSLYNLADLYQRQGELDQAEPLYERALAIWEQALGADHPYMGYGFHSLANLYRDRGRHSEAEPLYRRALTNVEALDPADARIPVILDDFAVVLRAIGETEEAGRLTVRAAALRDSVP